MAIALKLKNCSSSGMLLYMMCALVILNVQNVFFSCYAIKSSLEPQECTQEMTYHMRCHSWGFSRSSTIPSKGRLSEIHDGKGLAEALQEVENLDRRNAPIPNDAIFCILLGCTKRKDLGLARRLHTFMAKKNLTRISIFGDSLIRLFASCGSVEEAHHVFRSITKPTVYSWNAIISAFLNVGRMEKPLELYTEMQQRNVKPGRATYILLLKACSTREGLQMGKQIHNRILRSGIELHMDIGNVLVDMYAKGGELEESLRVFNELPSRDAFSYGSLLSGYTQHGKIHLAVDLFQRMQEEGIEANRVFCLCLMKACGKAETLELGRLVHRLALSIGLLSDPIVANTLMDMYVKCSSLQEAREVFDKLPSRNIVSWGIMITGYALHGPFDMVLKLYGEMLEEGIDPDRAILVGVLKVCATTGTIGQGRLIHDQAIRNGLESDLLAGNSLVDLYVKCGSVDEAYKLLMKMPNRDVVSWGTIIAGCMSFGDFDLTRQCLRLMKEEGIKPNDIIITSILAACSHAGLAEEGYKFFKSMTEDHGIVPSIDHCNCLVDLLGRLGYLNEAEKLVQIMSPDSSIVMWRSLLTGCMTYGNKELGHKCFNELVRLEPSNAMNRMLLLNFEQYISDA